MMSIEKWPNMDCLFLRLQRRKYFSKIRASFPCTSMHIAYCLVAYLHEFIKQLLTQTWPCIKCNEGPNWQKHITWSITNSLTHLSFSHFSLIILTFSSCDSEAIIYIIITMQGADANTVLGQTPEDTTSLEVISRSTLAHWVHCRKDDPATQLLDWDIQRYISQDAQDVLWKNFESFDHATNPKCYWLSVLMHKLSGRR